MTHHPEIWILGATGRSGRDLAAILARHSEVSTILVGRNAGRLGALAASLPGTRTQLADGPAAIEALIASQRPAAVVNLLGDYARSGIAIAKTAIAAGTHYVDLSVDLETFPALLGLHDDAARAGVSVVPGAGYGVVSTEAAVAKLCETHGKEKARRVRVDAVPSLEVQEGAVGPALAASIVSALAAGGKVVRGGNLARGSLGWGVTLVTPDGDTVTCGAVPQGDILAAARVSGAPDVSATSSFAPSGMLARLGMPIASMLVSLGPVRHLAEGYIAGVRPKPAPMERAHSWGHAVVTFEGDDGEHEAWLRAGDGGAFTNAVCAETTLRLVTGKGRPGAYTPCELFGSELAEAAGATFILGSGKV